MIDALSHQRIALLHPKIRTEVGELLDFVNTNVLTGKAKARITSTLRSFAEQTALYNQGRTTSGSIVTNAKAGQSNHNYGLSFDFALIVSTNDNGIYDQTSWSLVQDYDGDHVADWMEVINLYVKHGYESGSTWKSIKDFPHIQKTFGLSVAQCYQKYINKQFIPGTQYILI